MVGKRMDGNAAARRELAKDLDVLGLHQLDQVLHDDVHAVLMEVAMVAEAEQIELERLALHHLLARDVADDDGGEVWLAGDGAQAGELRADELHEVVVVRVLVVEGFQHFRGVVGPVLGLLAAQVGDALQVFRGSHEKDSYPKRRGLSASLLDLRENHYACLLE